MYVYKLFGVWSILTNYTLSWFLKVKVVKFLTSLSQYLVTDGSAKCSTKISTLEEQESPSELSIKTVSDKRNYRLKMIYLKKSLFIPV